MAEDAAWRCVALCGDEEDGGGGCPGPDIDIDMELEFDICIGPDGAVPGMTAAYPSPVPELAGGVVDRAPANATPYSCSITRCCMSYCGPRTGCSARRGLVFDEAALVRLPRRPCGGDCCTDTGCCPCPCPCPCIVNLASPRSISACSTSARSCSSCSFCGAGPRSPVTAGSFSVEACGWACCGC
jgi:hypothetical protein